MNLLEEWDRERSFITEAVLQASRDFLDHDMSGILHRQDVSVVMNRLGVRIGMPSDFAESGPVLESLAGLELPCSPIQLARHVDEKSLLGVSVTLGDRGEIGLCRLEVAWRALEPVAMDVASSANFNFAGLSDEVQTPEIAALCSELDSLRLLLKRRSPTDEANAWAVYYSIGKRLVPAGTPA